MRCRCRLAMAMLAASVLTSCQSGADDARTRDGRPSASPTPDPTVVAAVLKSYEAGWRADVENTTGKGSHHATDPRLAETMTGAALRQAEVDLFNTATALQYSLGTVEHSERVTALSDGRAHVEDCLFDRRTWYDFDGEVVIPPDEGRKLYRAVMLMADGHWKRAEGGLTQEPCEPR